MKVNLDDVKRILNFFFIVFLCCHSAEAQKAVTFKTGTFSLDHVNAIERSDDHSIYLFYSTDHILSTLERKSLDENGIEILYTLHDNIYWVRIKGEVNKTYLKYLFQIDPSYKIGQQAFDRDTVRSQRHGNIEKMKSKPDVRVSPDVRESPTVNMPEWRISIAPGLSLTEITKWAETNRITILDSRALQFGFIDVSVAANSFDDLINTQWISFIDNIPHDEPVNYRMINAERGWGLKSPLTRNLDGSGMTVGIGDEGRIGTHQDLSNSLLDLTSFSISSHSTEVAGIITGAGLVNPAFGSGYAPNAFVLTRNFSDILWASPQYISDFNLSLTNNSYGANLTDCTSIGDYDGTSAGLDQMMRDYPSLLHVFAAANSGGITCSPYPAGYATVAGGYQPSKNVLTVGAISITDTNASFSSRGPVDDGRLKPEVVAYGLGRFSTFPNNTYTSNSGTSFSSPATVGTATLLYQRYKQLHNDSLPNATLIKNVICNGADDLGTAGPDYIFGYGRINGVRSAEILETHHYTSVLVDNQQTIIKNITLPAGEATIDIMLMWSDPPAAPYETVALVNDLDLVVISPNGDTSKPWHLNYTPSGVSAAATFGPDHLNNNEQITIQTPVAGTYTISIKGYQVPMGPQLAWLSWDIQHTGITVQSPDGGEVFKQGNISLPNDKQYIRWDAYGTGSSTFKVEYKTTSGGPWTLLSNNIPSSQRYQDWFVPNIPTEKLKVRVTASNGMQDSSNNYAIILAPPANLTATTPCNGYIQLTWTPVPSSDHYEVFMLKNEKLISLSTTNSNSITLGGFAPDSVAWITVAAAFASGQQGLRAPAVQITPAGGNQCTWNSDIRLDSVTEPRSGRKFTSSELTSSETIKIHITNEGSTNATGFSCSYSINNGTAISQSFAGTLNAGAGQIFSFNQMANLSAIGSYSIKVWSTYPSDPFHLNDTLRINIRQLSNAVITLPVIEDFEAAPDARILTDIIGLPGLDAWDVDLESTARVRTFAGTPFCHSGQRALTVDATQNTNSKNANLFMTQNMSGYSAMSNVVLMSFYFMHHEIITDVINTEAVWIRGSDQDTFFLLTYLPNDANLRGIYQHVIGLNISNSLVQHSQNFSSSFQVKFTHDVIGTAGQTTSEDGQTIDDISFYLIQRDVTINQLLYPQVASCGLGTESLHVNLVNTTNKPIDSTIISWQINNGSIHSMMLGTIAGNTSINQTLNPAYDFTMAGTYHLVAWVTSPQDDFHGNDTLRIDIVNSPLITTFPYREGFETGVDGWISAGINSSWQSGTPGKEMISHAAEGQKIWTTNLTGTYNTDETSYLYSPCFDFTGFTQPYLSFAFLYQLEAGYDYAWVEYRIGGSTDWIKLGTQGSGTNWYNDASNRWNGSQSKWITCGNIIPVTNTTVQFRWVMQSDVGVEFEGLGIDQINVYDRAQIYNGTALQLIIPVSGNNWIHFEQGGQRIFSINPQGQNLGNVTMSLFKSMQPFSITDSLYLLSRNWVVTSSLPVNGAIKLRTYFVTTEANNLVNATGCAQCISARDAFDITAIRYSGANEDGLFSNDVTSQVHTYPLDSTDIQPYENGYYAEMSTTSLSEWWIASQVKKKAGLISRKVSSASDDAEEHQDNGSVNTIRGLLTMTEKNGQQTIGWRFRNITIPAGSYISDARIKWTSYDASSSASDWILRGELSADASTFITRKYNITLRPKTNQVVQWQPASWSVINQQYSSPDISHLIQNITDQSLWVNGNDLVLMIKGSGLRNAWSYDGDPSKSAELVITYSMNCIESGILYVDQNANGLQDGTSWTDAYRSFEQALDHAAHCPSISQIWIADGTYSPYPDVSRSTGFTISGGLNIYGGFQGNETNINQRVDGMYPTTLSGDIGTISNTSDNLYHVVTISGGNVLLDGLTIQGGLANGGTLPLQTGSGIYNQGILTCRQITLLSNSAPAFYNATGSQLISTGIVQVKP